MMTFNEAVKHAKETAKGTSQNMIVNRYWNGYAVTYLLDVEFDGFNPRYIVTPEGFIFNYSDLRNSLRDFQRQTQD